MLGKVLKKDFYSTWRFFLPLMGGYMIAAVVGKVLFEILLSAMDSMDSTSVHISIFSEGMVIFSIIYLGICMIYLIACYLMTWVFVVYDFYKTMVSSHGYLTHTLPVKTSILIWSKVLIAVMWQIVVNVIIFLSIMLIFTGHFSYLPVKEIFRVLANSWDMDATIHSGFAFINMITKFFHGPLLFFASIAMGQQWKEHRVIGAILAYMGISIASQILNVTAIMVTGVWQSFVDFPFSGYMIYTMIFDIVTTVGFFLITDYMLSRKLNLE